MGPYRKSRPLGVILASVVIFCAFTGAAEAQGGRCFLFAECPARADVPSYRCYLFPGPKGVCRYVCVPIDKK